MCSPNVASFSGLNNLCKRKMIICKAFRIKYGFLFFFSFFHLLCSSVMSGARPLLCCMDKKMTNDKGETVKRRDIQREKQETKGRKTQQPDFYAVCQHKESKMSVCVLHQWVMAAIIPPSGYKQAILAHCFHRVLHSGDTTSQHGKWSVKACEA